MAAPPHDNPLPSSPPRADTEDDQPPAPLVIIGGGIVGLVLALALDKRLNGSVPIDVYESSPSFEPDVGAGMGLYANGLRVIRDISPDLFDAIRSAGYPYLERRWERHDGTEVCVAEEGPALWQSSTNEDGDEKTKPEHELQTLGIRRWKLQQCLHDAVQQRPGITVHFGKRVHQTTLLGGLVEVTFQDGAKRTTQFLLAADGARSTVRSDMLVMTEEAAQATPHDDEEAPPCPKLEYTGVTCIMGVAEHSTATSSGEEQRRRGIAFPSSSTTHCHGCFYPTSENEDCFQFHFPIDPAAKSKSGQQEGQCQQQFDSCWGTLSQEVGRRECAQLADILQADGWHDHKYLKPLRHVTNAVRVGFCQLSPPLEQWVWHDPKNGVPRIALLGDASHPPVPYIGQGAQMGLEDAGTLALLLQKLCTDDQGRYSPTNLRQAMDIYQRIRIPRSKEILSNGHYMGNMQQKRAENSAYNIVKEELIQRQIFYHETVPVYFPGARYDYRQATLEVLKQEPTCLPTLQEEGNTEQDQPTKQPRSILKKPPPSRVAPCRQTFVEQVEC